MNTKTKTKTSTVVAVVVGVAAVGAIGAAAAAGIVGLQKRCVDNGSIQYVSASPPGYYASAPGYYAPGPNYYKTTPGYAPAVAAPAKCQRLLKFLTYTPPAPLKVAPTPISKPIVNHVDLTNTSLVNGQKVDLYKFVVTAVDGKVAIKQFKLKTQWADNETASILSLEGFRLYKNGIDITNSVSIVDQSGENAKDDQNTSFRETDDRLVVTWNTEDVVAQDATVTYAVRGTPTGFGIGDVVNFFMAGDNNDGTSHGFLNDESDQNTNQSMIMELVKAPKAGTVSGSFAEFLWSDISASPHSFTPNEQSSGDWYNGFNIQNIPLSSESWMKEY